MLIAFLWFDIATPTVDYDQIMEKGSATTGKVTHIQTLYNVTINGVHPSIISYKYSANGRDIDAEFYVLETTKVDNLSVGDSLEVKYLNDESALTSFDQYNGSWVFIFPLIFLLIGIIPISILWFIVSKTINLYKHGRVAVAEVLSMTRDQVTVRSIFSKPKLTSVVHYQYKDVMGKMLLGEAKTIDQAMINSIKTGDTIKIFVSPDNESRSTLIPRHEAVRNNWKVD